jgi:hypothetical protein
MCLPELVVIPIIIILGRWMRSGLLLLSYATTNDELD